MKYLFMKNCQAQVQLPNPLFQEPQVLNKFQKEGFGLRLTLLSHGPSNLQHFIVLSSYTQIPLSVSPNCLKVLIWRAGLYPVDCKSSCFIYLLHIALTSTHSVDVPVYVYRCVVCWCLRRVLIKITWCL